MIGLLVSQKVVGAVVRHVIGAAGVYLAAQGVEVTPGAVDQIAGGAVALASVVWSIMEKAGRA